jgi:hypothetical protein
MRFAQLIFLVFVLLATYAGLELSRATLGTWTTYALALGLLIALVLSLRRE